MKFWDIYEIEHIFNFPKGQSKFVVRANDISKSKTVNLFAIGITPLSITKSIKKEEQKAIKSRVNPKWFQNAGYGLMVHWFPQCAPRKGELKPYAEAVNNFDVEWFTNRIESSGAKYLKINLAGNSFPAPIVDFILEATHQKINLPPLNHQSIGKENNYIN